MGFEITWRSERGSRTEDNRDYCGVGLRSDYALCIVLDGASSGADSGVLAREVAHGLVDWFIRSDAVCEQAVIAQLRILHAECFPRLRFGSAAYVVALLNGNGVVHILHAGDCLAAFMEESAELQWCAKPHTLANALHEKSIDEVAASPLRNRLTRSFRAKAFMMPAHAKIHPADGQALVLATDGFWAALDEEGQASFLAAEKLLRMDAEDDCSALVIKSLTGGQPSVVTGSGCENFHVVRAE